MQHLKNRPHHLSDDGGSISALVVSLTMTFMVCAGLAIDGGRIVAAKIRVGDTAENAARAGAQALTDIRSGIPRIDAPRASRIASAYLETAGSQGRIEASQLEVCVTVRSTETMTLLQLVGVSTRQVAATRCAQPIME